MQRILFALIGHKISIIPSLTVNLKVEKAHTHTHVFLPTNSHLLPYNDFYESLTANCRPAFFGKRCSEEKKREKRKRKKIRRKRRQNLKLASLSLEEESRPSCWTFIKKERPESKWFYDLLKEEWVVCIIGNLCLDTQKHKNTFTFLTARTSCKLYWELLDGTLF